MIAPVALGSLGAVGGMWPTPEQELLLRAALWPDERGLAAWREFTDAGGDVRMLDAGTAALVPLLSRTIAELDPDEPQLTLMRGAHRKAWYDNTIALHRAAGALDILHAAGIPTLVYKGPALALRFYGALGSRPFADVDLLVPVDHGQRARVLLRGQGWEGDLRQRDRLVSCEHGEDFVHPGGGRLDLHWYMLSSPSDDGPAWEAAEPFEVAGRRTLALCPSDELVATIVHGMEFNPIPPLRWVADAMLIIERGEVDWDRVVSEALRRHHVPAVADALAYLERAIGAAIPDGLVGGLRRVRVRRRERSAYRWGLEQPCPRGGAAILWDHHRRLRALGRGHPRARTYAHYLRDWYELPSLRALPAKVARQAFLPPWSPE